jgi:hypothetical protein
VASYYTQFSAQIDRLTEEERAWLTEQLESNPEKLNDSEDESSEDESLWDFEWQFVNDSLHLWTMTGNGCCLGTLPSLVQKFLAKSRPLKSWSMLFALTCSSPVLNETTGGALFVTADSCEYMDGFQWVGEKRRQFKGNNEILAKLNELQKGR